MDPLKQLPIWLIESMPDAIAYHQLITDSESNPVDYRFIYVNKAFETMTGLTRDMLIDRRVTEILPEIKNSSFDWIRAYSRVAHMGEKLCFEQYSEALGHWYLVKAYSEERGFFVTVFQDISDRKKAEESLNRSERKYLEIYHSINDAIFILDSITGAIIDVNESAVTMYGCNSKRDMIGNVNPFSHTEAGYDHKKAQEMIQQALVSSPSIFEWHAKKKDGETFWVEVSLKRTVIDDKERILAVVRDITNRKEAQENLYGSRELLLKTQEIAHIGSWELDTVKNHLTWSDEVYRIFGLPKGVSLTYEDFLHCIHIEDRSLVDWAYQSSLQEKTDTYEIEHRIIKQDTGEIRSVHERCLHQRDDSGEIVRSVGMVQDITERKLAEEALQHAEETYRNIFLNSQIGLFRTSIEKGLLLDGNNAVAQFIGFEDREEMLAKPFSIAERYVDPEDRMNMIHLLKEHGEINDYEAPFRRNDGSIRLMRFSAKLVPEKGWIEGVSEDITERIQAQEDLRRSEEKHRRLFETMVQGVIYQDRDGHIISANPAAERILGLSFQEMQGKTSMDPRWQMIEEDGTEVPGTRHPAMMALRTGERVGPVIRGVFHPDKDAHVWLKIIAIPLFQPGEREPFQAYATFEDITEQIQAGELLHYHQQETQKAHQRLLTVLESMELGINVIDMETYEILFINGFTESLYGDIVGEVCWRVFKEGQTGPCDFCTNVQLLDATGRPAGVFHSEYCNEKTGRWYESRDIAIQWIDGRTVRLEMALDITERKSMEEKIQYQHEFQKVVAHISYNFMNTPSSQLDEAIHYTLYQIGTFFQVDRSYLFQFSPDAMSLTNTHKWNREGIEPVDIVKDLPLDNIPWLIHEIRSKDYVFLSDINEIDNEEERNVYQRKDIQSFLLIPIKVKERMIGFMGMDAVREKRVWTDEEVTLLKVIGEIISSAFSKHQIEQELIQKNQEVEKLNRYLNKEMDRAHHIHNHILPEELPSIKGISFATYYQPAETLGGDFYDVIQADDRLIIYLSDISGHGLDGSMVNFFLKEAIDSYIVLKPDEISPGNILRHLHRQYSREDYPEELFICIFLAVLDLETMDLVYTGAGFQDTPLVRHGDGEEVFLTTKGLFINSIFSMEMMNFQEKKITLTPGSTIFFNTDGLTEQGEPGDFYRNRLSKVFFKKAHLPPHEISQAVVEDFRHFNKGSLQGDDDITFLILQVEPETRRYHIELSTDFGELGYLKDTIAEILPDREESQVLMGCLYEFVANAIEHGNQMDSKKRVFMEFIVSHEYIQVSIEDEGEGFNWWDKVGRPLELEGYTERGRGIAMGERLCDSLFYNEQGNRVTCIFTSFTREETSGSSHMMDMVPHYDSNDS